MRKTSLFVTIALVGQIVLGSLAQAALVPSNEIGTDLIGFDLDGTTYSVNGSGQQAGAGAFAQGQINDYPEGSCIPALITATNNDDEAGDIAISPTFDFSNTQNSIIGIESLEVVTTTIGGGSIEDANDLSDFVYTLDGLETATTFPSFTVTGNGNNQVVTDGSVSATVSGAYAGNNTGTSATASTDAFRHYNVTLLSVDPGESVVVLLCARIGKDASEWQGATPSLRLAGEGQENVGIQTSQLLVLPTLTLIKEVVGSNEPSTSWSFNVSPAIDNQTSFSTTLNQDGSASVTIENVSPDGVYAITESGPSGYTLSAGTGSLNCTFSGATASGTLAAGKPATDATCVFTNTYNAPTTGNVTVTKVVVNDDNGTSQVSDFALSVGQTAVFSGATNAFSAGSYTVSESGPSGYAATFTGDCDAQGNLTVVAGQSYTCTITNNDITPPPPTTGTLTVVKQVINDDGGTSQVSDFALFIDQTSVTSGQVSTLSAGTFVVSETSNPNYAATFSGNCDSQGSVTLVAGQNLTCTITNNDIAVQPQTGTITVVKIVSGGTAQVSDFALFIDQTQVTSGQAETLVSGSYVVSESSLPNYTGAFSGDCDSQGLVNLGANQNLTCTITNTYTPPAPTTGNVTVTKIVVNDDGGASLVSDFTLSVDQTTVLSGATNTFAAGSYAVSEAGPSGYVATFSGDCDAQGNLTVVAGQSYACTITNDDIAVPPATGVLTVVKSVINDNGGTAVVSDFPLFIDLTSVTSGSSSVLPVGNYVVSETGSPDYVAVFSGDCDVNGAVTLASGDQKTCTITNDDKVPTPPGGGGSAPQAGTLVVVTKVINDDGGSAMPSSFTMTVGDGISVSSTFGGFDTPGINLSYAPGAYVVNGSTSPSYTQTKSANCSGTMVANLTVTCVVTYDDLPTGGSGGNPVPPTPPAPPAPQVLGVTDSATGPVPQVLGATDDELPVTGMPAWTLSALLLAAAPFLRRKRA